jgi:predicted dinucleotide-binding enzyme
MGAVLNPDGTGEQNVTTIAVVGGTGPQGRGLAYRFPLAGHEVRLGSPDGSRAQDKAEAVNTRLDDPRLPASGFHVAGGVYGA